MKSVSKETVLSLSSLTSLSPTTKKAIKSLSLIPPISLTSECASTLGSNIFETFFNIPCKKFVNKIARIDHKLDNIRHYIIEYGKMKTVDRLLDFLQNLEEKYMRVIGHEFLQITCRKTSKNLGISAYFSLIHCIIPKFEFEKYYLKAFYVVPRNINQIWHMIELMKTWEDSDPEEYSSTKLTLFMNFFLVSIEKLSTLQRIDDIELLFIWMKENELLRFETSNLLLKSLSIYIITLINKRESLSRITNALKYVDELELKPSEIFYNKLLEVLSKNFRNDNLHSIFLNHMIEREVESSLVTYNTLLTITSMSKNFKKCLDIFNMIIENKLQPDSYSLALLVRSLKQSTDVTKENVNKILEIHKSNSIKLDTVLCNSMIDVFMSMKLNDEALKVFISMKEDSDLVIDNITFNSLIKGFCRNGFFEEGNLIFQEMKKDFKNLMPNRIIFNSLMDASLKVKKLDVAMGLFMEMQTFDISPDSFTYSILLNGLKQAKASQRIIKKTLVSIKQILDISDFKLDEIFFNCILDTCSKYEMFNMMDYFYKVMKKKKIPESDITYGILIKAYGKLGNFNKAESLFNEMMGSNLRINNITYGCVLDACSKNGKMEEAMKIFEKLKENYLHLNSVVFTTIIKGYINAEKYQDAISFFLEIKENDKLDGMLITYNCALDAYVRLGETSNAIALFKEIDTRFKTDLVSFSTILKVFIQNNMKEKAYIYFLRLLNSTVMADISIVNLFLDSCANYSDYNLALKIYEQADLHKIKPNEVTFGIMIKVYGFSRHVKKAFGLIALMKAYRIVPSIIVYTNLIHISFYNKKLKNVEKAYSMLKKDKVKGDRLLYSKLIDGFLRFKEKSRAIKYLNFAHQEKCPIKPEVWEKLNKIMSPNDPNRTKLEECANFKEKKFNRKVFGQGKKDNKRTFGKKYDYSNRRKNMNNNNTTGGNRSFYNNKRNEGYKTSETGGQKKGTLFNFRKRVIE